MATQECVFPITAKPAGSKTFRIPKELDDIQEAFDRAKQGDCICISSGTYTLHEPLLLDKDIHILGDSDGLAQGVVLQLDRRVPTLTRPDLHMLTTSTQSARITNLTFVHTDSSNPEDPAPPEELVFCVFAREGNIIIDNCSFRSTFASGLGVGSNCRPTVTNCRFTAREYGIFCSRQSMVRVSRSTFHTCGTGVFFDDLSRGPMIENRVQECRIGMDVTAGAYPNIEQQAFHSCSSVGVYFSSGRAHANTAEFSGNEVADCEIGVLIEQDGSPLCKKNIIQNCKSAGMQITNGGSGEARLNEISGCGIGIEVGVDASPKVLGNVVHSNKQAGIEVWGKCSVPVLKENEIYSNEVGISMRDEGSGAILQNNVRDNVGWGLVCLGASESVIQGNTLIRNAVGGMRTTSTPLDMKDNEIVENGIGVHLVSASGRMKGNVVKANRGVGVDIDGCGESQPPTLLANTISDNGAEGILVHNGSTVKLQSNEVTENDGQDLYCALNSTMIQ